MASTTLSVLPHNVLLASARCTDCTLCSAEGYAKRPVFGRGSTDAQLVIVGEAPGYLEVREGIPFIGPSGELLWSTFKRLGVSRDETYVTNALLCQVPAGSTVTPTMLRACAPRLVREIRACSQMRVLLCLGAKAADSVREVLELPKLSITMLSGRVEYNDTWNCHIVYSFHPAAVLRNPTHYYNEFDYALRNATRVLRTGKVAEHEPFTHEVASLDDVARVIATLERALGAPTLVCDLETTGLDARAKHVLDVGLCWSHDFAYVLPFAVAMHGPVYEMLKRVLEHDDTKVVGHNFKFDQKFLQQKLKLDIGCGGDTMLMHHALDERGGGEQGGAHDLKSLARRYCNAPAYADGIDTEHMAAVPDKERHEYLANDLIYTYRLYHIFRDLLLKEPASREGYPTPYECHERFLTKVSDMLSQIELRGIHVNTERLISLYREYDHLLTQVEQRVANMIGKEINPNSTKQVGEVLYTPVESGGMGYALRKSTDEETLHELQRLDRARKREPNPFIDAVLEYRSLLHTRSSYLEGTMRRILRGAFDGRISTTLSMHRTTSGRLSSSDPNLQNLPADSVIKELFVPSKDHEMCNADFRQLEVRVLIWYSGDEELAKICRQRDVHWATAVQVFPAITDAMLAARGDLRALEALCQRTTMFRDFAARQARDSERTESADELFDWMKARIRRQAKTITFGNMYGEGPEALAGAEKGLDCEVSEAREFQTRWRALYHVAWDYLQDTALLARTTRWVESASGRRRRFLYPRTLDTHIANEAMNHPIQSYASDINTAALLRLNKLLPDRALGNVLMPVHDSILSETRKDQREAARTLINDTMSGIQRSDLVTFEVDIKFGENWGACR